MKISTWLFALMLMLFLAMPVFAHTDPPPAVYVNAYFDNKPVREVDTDVNIRILAEDNDFKAGLIYLQLLEDGKPIARKDCSFSTRCEAEYTVHHELKGRHTYSAVAVDRSDNKKISIVGVTFLGRIQAPILVFEEHPYAEEGYSLNLLIIAEDKNKDTVTVQTSPLPRGARFDGTYLIWTPDYNQSGIYNIKFTATNSKGLKSSKTMTIDVKDVNRPPQIMSVDPSSENIRVFEGDSATFSMNVFDPDNKLPSTEWILDNKRVSSSRAFTYKPDYNSAGFHVLVGRVYDKDFAKRHVWNITVENVNRPPTMAKLSPKKIKEGETVKFSVSASDPDKNPLTYKVTGLPSGARFDPDTRVFEWKPIFGQAGVYDVLFSATDSEGFTDSETISITVVSEGVDPDFHKLYDEYFERARQIEQQDKPIVSGANAYQNVATGYQQLKNITLPKTCSSDYLCYTVTYFVG